MSRTLHFLSGGAAQGLVSRLQAAFEQQHDCRLQGTYGAVGLMRERLIAGDPCDVLILSEALITGLVKDGRADAATPRTVGGVKTGLAVKEGQPAVAIRGPED